MSATHNYRPLAERYIRLLKIPEFSQSEAEPDLVEVSLDVAPPYETVSYVWGEQNKSCVFNFRFGTSVLITPTLRSTLARVRSHCETGYLWVDQLCTNQASITECNQQVALMGEIYSNCQRVLICLGQEVHDYESMSYYFESAPFAGTQLQTSAPSASSEHRVLASQKELIFEVARQQSFVRFLLSLPWFSRAWVVQEAVLSAEATCFLGPFRFSIDELWAIIRRFRSSEDRILSENYVGLRQLQGYLVLSEIMRLRDEHRTGGESADGQTSCFYHSLSLFAPLCRTSTRHDIIYAFLGLQTDTRIRILPNYNLDWNEVPLLVTRSIIEGSESLDLMGVVHRRDDDESRWSNLPSWVPDWSRPLKGEAMVFPKSSMYFKSSSRMRHKSKRVDSISSSSLVISGKIIDEVSHKLAFTEIPTEPATSRHQWPAHLYLNLSHLKDLLAKIWPQQHTVPSRELILKTCLADGSFAFNRTPSSQQREGLSASAIQGLLKTYDALERLSAQQNIQSSKSSKSSKEKATKLRDHARIAWGRQLIIGRDWRLGLAHDTVDEGDLICIAHGSKVPLVLRRLPSGYYRFMGQCYLEGAMRGEEVNWDEAGADEFVLV